VVSGNRLKAYLSLGASFLLGGVAAGAAYHGYAEQRYAELFSGDREALEARRAQALSRELGLDSEQTQQVRAIFAKHAPERKRLMRQAMDSCGGPLHAHRERIDAEIEALLDPEEKRRFEAWRAERRHQLFGAPEPSSRAP
jgi:hypothetical protein